jgi:hypothetical protein
VRRGQGRRQILEQDDLTHITGRIATCSIRHGGADGYTQTKVILANPDKRRALIGAILNRISSILDLHPLPELDELRQVIALTRAEHGIGKVEQVTGSPSVQQLEATT